MMTKQEALETLGLHEDSLRTDIETRYATLVKRYRSEQNVEKLEEISLAYNIITGRYVEPVADTPAMKKVILGRTRKEWSNIWLYGRYKFLAIAVGVAFVAYFIYTVATNTPGDFKLAAVGDFYIPDTEAVSDYVLSQFTDFKKVDISSAYLSPEGSSGFDAANQQKAMILVSVSGEDVIVIDKASFDRYAPMGAFADISDLYDEVAGYPETAGLELAGVQARAEGSDGEPGAEKVYGIDLSGSQLLSAIGISGRNQILTISIKSERPETAKEFIRKLMRDAAELLPDARPLPDPTPTTVPTPTTPPTPATTP